jgi:phosphopantetheinyl transferase
MDTKLVLVDIRLCGELLSRPGRFCSKARLEDSARISDPERRMQGLAAELALSFALSGDELLPPGYSRDESGRPLIGEGYVSLAHSGNFAACAVSDVPVGVDIETLREVSPALSRRLLCPRELKEWENTSDEYYILRRFVIKEAYLKLTGEGLSGGFTSLYCTGGRIFRRGVLSGFAERFDSSEYSGAVVTLEKRPISLTHLTDSGTI